MPPPLVPFATTNLISDRELLRLAFGTRATAGWRDSLSSVFDFHPAEDSALHCSTLRSRSKPSVSPLLRLRAAAARELVQRWLQLPLQHEPLLTQPERVRDYLRLLFASQTHESFQLLFLDAQNRLIQNREMFRGTLDQTAVYPREIVKAALQWNAAAVIFAHNHPSGACTPSQADRQLTQSLQKALALVDIRVLDHFIVAANHILSFAEHGWL